MSLFEGAAEIRKISSENLFTVKVELSLCTGGQCHDLETKMKMKVLKNIFWAVICIIGVVGG